MFTVAEVAKILRVSEARVYEVCRQGLLPHVRLGRQVRIDPKSLDSFIEGGGKPLTGGWRRSG